jgi:hypothetical protein
VSVSPGTHATDGDGRAVRPAAAVRARRYRWTGMALIAVPFTLFAILAVGEAATLEPGWWSHLLQVVAVVLLGALAWSRPAIGGAVLVVTGLVFTVLALVAFNEVAAALLAIAVFLVPLIVAGVLFILAGRAWTAAS